MYRDAQFLKIKQRFFENENFTRVSRNFLVFFHSLFFITRLRAYYVGRDIISITSLSHREIRHPRESTRRSTARNRLSTTCRFKGPTTRVRGAEEESCPSLTSRPLRKAASSSSEEEEVMLRSRPTRSHARPYVWCATFLSLCSLFLSLCGSGRVPDRNPSLSLSPLSLFIFGQA